MTRSADEVAEVGRLLALGVSQAQAARMAGVPRGTLRGWVAKGIDALIAERAASCAHHLGETQCDYVRTVPAQPYAYVLGLYLGDGCLSAHHSKLYRLRISLDAKYPSIIDECEAAMAAVLDHKVGRVQAPGCVSVGSYSQHWPCLFPQHAAGAKHLRRIELQPWQEEIAIEAHPRLLLRGLVHSDGYRGQNRIGIRYSYPRYMFSNRSQDIRDIFATACDRVGITVTQCGHWQLSVARRRDVALMDTFIGPKR